MKSKRQPIPLCSAYKAQDACRATLDDDDAVATALAPRRDDSIGDDDDDDDDDAVVVVDLRAAVDGVACVASSVSTSTQLASGTAPSDGRSNLKEQMYVNVFD